MQSPQDNNLPMEFSSKDHFSLWDYNPGHSQLLLRYPRDIEGARDENLDVIFIGVFYMRIPPTFHGLKIMIAPPQQAEEVFQEIDWSQGSIYRKTGQKQIFQIITEGRTYYVGATTWRIDRNTLPFHETSLEQPGKK